MPSVQQRTPTNRTHTPATGKSVRPTQGPGDQAADAGAGELTYSAPAGEELPPVLEAGDTDEDQQG